DYEISNQISDYLIPVTVLRLSVKKPTPITYSGHNEVAPFEDDSMEAVVIKAIKLTRTHFGKSNSEDSVCFTADGKIRTEYRNSVTRYDYHDLNEPNKTPQVFQCIG